MRAFRPLEILNAIPPPTPRSLNCVVYFIMHVSGQDASFASLRSLVPAQPWSLGFG